MKVFVALAFLVVAVSAASDQDLWVEFKSNHGKTYRSLREEKLRFNIFQEKLHEIESHNAKYEKGEVSYFLSVNQFSDLTTEEFVAILNKNIATKPKLEATPFENEVAANLTAPNEINWVTKGAVLGVQNQGDCGSCWAFSSTGSIEGQIAIHHKKKVSLSEQQLVDCCTKNYGCVGGSMPQAFDYIKQHGLSSESAYPYKAVQGTCKSVQSVVKIKGYVSVAENDENALKTAVGNVGPVSIGVDASLWQSYGGGIFDDERCSEDELTHAVVAVGYGHSNGQDYWLIKNCWGTSWGQKGYMQLARNKNNRCGVANFASYPKLL